MIRVVHQVNIAIRAETRERQRITAPICELEMMDGVKKCGRCDGVALGRGT